VLSRLAFLRELEVLDLGRRQRHERPEPAREPGAEAYAEVFENGDRIDLAEPRRPRLVSDAIFAREARTFARQSVAIDVIAAHAKDDVLVVDRIGLVDARDDDAILRRAVEGSFLLPVLAERARGREQR
jgi:hypothetical protein